MVDQGLLSCQNSLGEGPCIVKLVECLVSVVMVLFVLYDLFRRLAKEFRLSFYATIELAMILTLVFIIVFSLDSDIRPFNYLSAYFYDVYFSIIVLKLGLKTLEIMRQNVNYSSLKILAFVLFAVYQVLILIALIYVSIKFPSSCLNLPFLIANSISLFASVTFIFLGVKHSRQQQQKLDESLSRRMQANPLPRFKCWIALNCFGQLIVLIQSIVFQINECEFSSDKTVNEVCILIFVFLSSHLGIAATIYFFSLTTRPFQEEKQDSTELRQTSPSIHPREKAIQMVYVDLDHTRDKADSQ